MHFSTLLATVLVSLLRSSWHSCFMRAALIKCERPFRLLCLHFLCRLRFSSILTHKNQMVYMPTWNSCICTPNENWTHVDTNLFTRNSPYYHLLKYLLFLLKHPVYGKWNTACLAGLTQNWHYLSENQSCWKKNAHTEHLKKKLKVSW